MSTKYTDLIKSTAQLCKSKRTGCMIYSSNNGDSGRIFIKAGKIVGLECGEKTGLDCFSTIVSTSQIDAYEFKEIPVVFSGTGLPDTSVLLNALIQRKPIDNATQKESEAPRSTSEATLKIDTTSIITSYAPSPSLSAQTTGGLSASQKTVIRDSLMALIGPMADFLSEEHVDNADSLEEALLGLEEDIDADSLSKLRDAVSKAL